MSNSVKILAKSFILLIYIFIILSILESHYVTGDECASRVYYYPLGKLDYFLIISVGIIMCLLSVYFIRISQFQKRIECSIYSIIIFITIVFGNTVISSRTEDWPETYKVKPVENSLCKTMRNYIENKDSVFNEVHELISQLTKEDDYNTWEQITKETIGVTSCIHSSDYEYLRHKLNVMYYLNWHLNKQISKHLDCAIIKEINTNIALLDSLYSSQCDFLRTYLHNQDIRYETYGISTEIQTITNINLLNFYMVINDGMSKFTYQKITQIDDNTLDCPVIDDSLIDELYDQFISECIISSRAEQTSNKEKAIIISKLSEEYRQWKRYIIHRNYIESILPNALKEVWSYNTKVWKLNKIRQLKNEFECYGTMCELDYSLSLQDCNFVELMNYHSLSKAWEDHKRHPYNSF